MTIFTYSPPGVTAPQPVSEVRPGRACCCPARPVVRAVMPPSPWRRHETELLLCGHHYRVSRRALAAARASIILFPEPPDSPPTALLPGMPRPRVPAR